MIDRFLCLAMVVFLFSSCKKKMEVAPDESIDISIIAKDGIASYKIQEDGSALLVKERFDALDEIYDFEFTTPEMDSIRKAIRRLEDLSVPKSEANVDANNYAIIIKTADADIKLYTNKKDSNAINNFTDNLDKYFLSSKSIEVFKSREGLVYPPPPPMSDRMIDEVKFVNPSSGN